MGVAAQPALRLLWLWLCCRIKQQPARANANSELRLARRSGCSRRRQERRPAAQRCAAARSHYTFQTMSRPAPLGRWDSWEHAAAACSVDLVRRVVQAGMASWLRPPSNRTKLRTKH